MNKKIILSCCMALNALATWAGKANPAPFLITQSDGTQLTVYQHGDEHASWSTTTDGVLLTTVGKDFYIANIDANGRLKASNQLAHNEDKRTAAEKKLIKKQQARHDLFFSTLSRQLQHEAKTRAIGTRTPAYFPHTGSPKVLVILAQFSDVSFSLPDPKKSFNDYFNFDSSSSLMPDYANNEKRNHGSVKQYFKDMSNGQFTPQFDIVGPITVPNTSMYYGKDGAGENNHDLKIAEFITDACNAVAAQGSINFADYDSNDDGFVDLVYVLFAGYGQNAAPETYKDDLIWPKSWTLPIPLEIGGKKIMRYGVSNELNYFPGYPLKSGPSKRINGIGLFCHEFSHTMGLPDFYPYNKKAQKDNQAMEIWDLMDGGEYTDNGYTPTPYTPWEKEQMGWKTLSTITETPSKVTLQADEALKIPTSYAKEYLILHNIQNKGWASKLPGHGMLVYRVNYELDNVNSNDHVNDVLGTPGMTIVPADRELISSYSAKTKEKRKAYMESYAGDPYPGSRNVQNIGQIVLNHSTLNKPLFYITEDSANGDITFEYLKDLTAAGINDITTGQQIIDNRIYTLDGRYVGTDRDALPHGIYIQNRRKFIK